MVHISGELKAITKQQDKKVYEQEENLIRQQISVTVWTKSTLHDWYRLKIKHPYGKSSQKAKPGSLGVLHPPTPLKDLSNSFAPLPSLPLSTLSS